MTAEQQGLYRNLLDEIWLRPNNIIPDDPRILAKISGDGEAWARSGPTVLKWMVQVDGGWTNKTALGVIAMATHRAERQVRYRQRVADERNARRNEDHNATHNAGHNADHNGGHNKGRSPSPSPSLKIKKEEVEEEKREKRAKPRAQQRRFTVMDWMHGELQAILGTDAEGFDLDGWYITLDAKMAKNGAVDTSWPWLRQQCLREARARGLIVPSVQEQQARVQQAKAMPASVQGRTSCPHDPPCPNTRACTTKQINENRKASGREALR